MSIFEVGHSRNHEYNLVTVSKNYFTQHTQMFPVSFGPHVAQPWGIHPSLYRITHTS